jgi:hypothetical protein
MARGGARPGAGRKPKDKSDGKYGERVKFTNEQLQELLSSPHVAFVSRTTVTYTAAFKEAFWQRYVDGVDPMQIFADAGINPAIVGRNRAKGLADSLRQQKERGIAFNDGKVEPSMDKPEKLFDMPSPPRRPRYYEPDYKPEDVAKMAVQVKYLTQEIEFLKKIILADKERK